MTRFLITGGDRYDKRQRVFDVLDWVHETRRLSAVIHAGSESVVDAAVVAWCQLHDVPVESHEGAVDSLEVLDQFRPDVVFHFRGDDSLARVAHGSGIEVLQLQ